MPGSTHLEPYKRLDQVRKECARERERRMELERRLERLEQVAQGAKEALETLDDGALGRDPKLGYPYRDELVDRIEQAIQ